MKQNKKLVTVVLPQPVLAEAKQLQKKHGIRTLSSLLRTAIEEKSSLKLTPRKEKTSQISFRVNTETVDALTKMAKQNKRSLAEIIRLLIANVSRLSAKKLAATAESAKKKTVAPKKKPVAKAKAPARAKSPAKSAKAKPVAKSKSAPAKKVAKKAPAKALPKKRR